ncbi:MAG: SGNH/GDSL hydrolase family protein [Promethearchaeota archaeon]
MKYKKQLAIILCIGTVFTVILIPFFYINDRNNDRIKPILKISTIGDSITRGLFDANLTSQGEWLPYTYQYYLWKCLRDMGNNSEVFNYGIPGQLVSEICARINQTIPADIIIIMGGTNDVLRLTNLTPDIEIKMTESIIEFFNQTIFEIEEFQISIGLSPPLIILNAIPPLGDVFLFTDRTHDLILYINQELESFITDLNRTNVIFCDVHEAMRNKNNYLDSGLGLFEGIHFTQAGYQICGETIAQCIFEYYIP